MLTLHQLQDRMCLHAGREEAESSKRVGISLSLSTFLSLIWNASAKYIEGLENRLGRMESLLKMSGLLSDEDAGRTDLGTLEKRLAEKVSTNGEHARRDSARPSTGTPTVQASDSHHSTPHQDLHSSPRTSVASPPSEGEKEKQEEVENLSDMMCSLVTNNCGETRYIGK